MEISRAGSPCHPTEMRRALNFGTQARPTEQLKRGLTVKPPRLASVLLLYGMSLLLRPDAARAQHAEGVVRDETGLPISDVYVTLLDEAQKLAAAALTGKDGIFTIHAPSSGAYYLRVARIGYRSLVDGPYSITRGDPLDVSVVMHPLPLGLDPLEVTVEGGVGRLAAVGYYERKEAGFGRFVEREEIRRTGPMRLTDVLRRLPWVSVSQSPVGGLNPVLLMRGDGAGACSPTLYIDGVVVAQGGSARRRPVRPDDWVVPEDVEAVEVYPGPASVPIQFQALAECGVLLIWTRHASLTR